MIFPGTSTSSAAREAIVQHPYISLQVGTSLVAMLIEIVESPLTEYYLQRVMQERQMKKMQTCKKLKVISAVFNFIQLNPFLGETWLLNVMIIIQETHRLHV